MLGALSQFASSEATEKSSDILSTLGIDFKLLILQTIAFLLLLWILSKFVFPVLGAMLDKREKDIEESVKAAYEAEKNAEAAREQTAKLMKQARKDADEIISTAKAESTAMVDKAEKKSRERADQIMADAEDEITKNIAAAKKSLRQETLDLVAEATQKVVGKTVDASVDKKVMQAAVEEAKTS